MLTSYKGSYEYAPKAAKRNLKYTFPLQHTFPLHSTSSVRSSATPRSVLQL